MKLALKAIAIGAMAALLPSSVQASDLKPVPSLKDDANYATSDGVVNWTGFYIGGQFGYGNASHELSVQERNWQTDAFDTVEILDGINSSGIIGGGRIGFDLARGRYLVGVFADYNWSGMETTASFGNSVGSLEKDSEWTIGGRAGYLVAPRTLAYVLAGYTQTEYSLRGDALFGSGDGLRSKNIFDGVSLGGGVEVALGSNVFAGLEYIHTFYGDEKWFEDECSRVTDTLDEDKVMATLKIKFNNGLGF